MYIHVIYTEKFMTNVVYRSIPRISTSVIYRRVGISGAF